MRLTVKKKGLQTGEIFRYLGEHTNLLNEGQYRTFPDILSLVIDHKVNSFLEVGRAESRVSELLVNIFHDVNVTCISPDGLDVKFKNLNVVTELSNNVVGTYVDNSFDMIYFDEHDSYDTVLNNLNSWVPKVRAGGIIAGYDYTRGIATDTSPTEFAVEHFLDEHGFAINSGSHNFNFYWFTKK